MTLTLEISEEQERVLREAARQRQTSPESLILLMIGTLSQSGAEDTTDESRRERVKDAGDYVQKKNAELYERLA